jgi:hypothetical protein
MRAIISGNKYEIIFNQKTGELKALRHGEEWRDLTGDGMVLGMLQKIDDLREEVDRLHKLITGR